MKKGQSKFVFILLIFLTIAIVIGIFYFSLFGRVGSKMSDSADISACYEYFHSGFKSDKRCPPIPIVISEGNKEEVQKLADALSVCKDIIDTMPYSAIKELKTDKLHCHVCVDLKIEDSVNSSQFYYNLFLNKKYQDMGIIDLADNKKEYFIVSVNDVGGTRLQSWGINIFFNDIAASIVNKNYFQRVKEDSKIMFFVNFDKNTDLLNAVYKVGNNEYKFCDYVY